MLPVLPPSHPLSPSNKHLVPFAAEDEEAADTLQNSVNLLSGGDTYDNAETEPVQSTPAKDGFKGTWEGINWYKHKGKKANPGPSNSEYLMQIKTELEVLEAGPFCINKHYGGKIDTKYTCLHILQKPTT